MSDDMVNILEAIRAGQASKPPECGWVKLYTPSGAFVTLPVTAERLDYAAMLANVEAMIGAGFAVLAPGLVEGEQKDTVGWCCRRAKTNRDGNDAAIIDLYPDNDATKYKMLIVYLDTPEDVRAFEYASGLELEHMPLWEGSQPLERGQARTDKYIIRAPHPFEVVMGPHPKYDAAADAAAKAAGKTYTIPKKKFVRWGKERPGAAASGTPAPSRDLTPAQAASLWKEAKDFLDRDPSLADFNDWIKRNVPSGPRDVLDKFWAGVRRHAQACGFEWNERTAAYVQPRDS